MTPPAGQSASRSKHWARLLSATWVVLAIALLAVAALPLAAPADPSAIVRAEPDFAEAEAEEDWEYEEGCEETDEGEFLEGELEVLCEEAADEERAEATSAGECLLRSARARAVAYARTDKLKLTIGYTTYDPVNATIELGRGSLRLGSTRRHLGRSGVIRLTKKLNDSQAKKVEAAGHIAVQLGIAGVPSSCKRVGSLSPRLVLFPR